MIDSCGFYLTQEGTQALVYAFAGKRNERALGEVRWGRKQWKPHTWEVASGESMARVDEYRITRRIKNRSEVE